MGVMSIMMMSNTSITSTSGVTLMSDLTPPLAPPRSIAIAESPELGSDGSQGSLNLSLSSLLDEVVHLDVEVLDARGQVVVNPDSGNRDDQTERGLDERFRNTDRDGADTGRTARADALECVDDADDRAEQSDEWRGGSDCRERGHALLEV